MPLVLDFLNQKNPGKYWKGSNKQFVYNITMHDYRYYLIYPLFTYMHEYNFKKYNIVKITEFADKNFC